MNPLAVNQRGRGLVTAGLVLAALVATFALGQQTSALASSSSVSRQCQHPLVTGQEAIEIKNVTPATACRTVRALARFIGDGSKSLRLYECAGAQNGRPGRPVLVIHRFEGWRLAIVKTYGFRMSRGRGSFEVTGQDFPLNCS